MAFNYKLISQVKAAADRVRVVLPYEDQYLMETLQNPKWPQNFGKRRFVGGGIDEGETPEQAAARELMEELGAKIDSVKFKYLGLDPNETKHKLHYLQLDEHDIKPGKYKTTVGSDPFIYLNKGMPSGDDYMGPELKALIKQVKEAMHKVAAPVPPEEVTGEKPYVRPQYMEPEQPAAIDPQSGMRRDVTERLLKDMYKNRQEQDSQTWRNLPLSFDEVLNSPTKPNTDAMIKDLRKKYKMNWRQDIADVPEALKEYQQKIKPVIEKNENDLKVSVPFLRPDLSPQEAADEQYFHDTASYAADHPMRKLDLKRRYDDWYYDNVSPLSGGLTNAKDLINTTNRRIQNELLTAKAKGEYRVKDLYKYLDKKTPAWKTTLGLADYPTNNPEYVELQNKVQRASDLALPYMYSSEKPNYKPIAWASSLPLRAAMGYATPSKPVVTNSLPTTLGQTAANSLKAFPYADRGYGGFYPRVDPNKPATKPNIPYSPASHMDAGAPMLDRRFSRTDVNAAKPAAPVQQPAPKPVTPNLPAVSTAKPVGGGRNY